MTAPRTIALTGATGFIGRRVARALLDRGHRVCALVRQRADAPFAERVQGCASVLLDLDHLDVERAARALDGTSVLVHCAAHIPSNQRDPGEAARCLQINALATLALVEGAIAARCAHMVHLSSGNVYEPSDHTVNEHAPVYPAARATYYLASKLCGELYVEHARLRGALPTTTLRVSSVYGPSMKGGVVPLFVAKLSRGERVSVSDGGRYRADLVYVDDVVDATLAAIERPADNGLFNVGSGAATTLLDLARAIARRLGREDDAITVEPEASPRGDRGFSALDIARAQSLLGYSPRSLDAGLDQMLLADAVP